MDETLKDKGATVSAMFDNIAPSYDFLNHLMSFNIDKLWRKRVVRIISQHHDSPNILDVATGTADLAIAAMKANPSHITGIDISMMMLDIGREKIERRGLSSTIDLVEGKAEEIPFANDSFDVATTAFGVRNFADPLKGLESMYRVVKSNGLIVVLEFSKPSTFPFKQLYNFYFTHLLPFIGGIVSHDKEAYHYLPNSVMAFPDGERFLEMLERAGFVETSQKKLTGGIATIYTGLKRSKQ